MTLQKDWGGWVDEKLNVSQQPEGPTASWGASATGELPS